MRGFDQTTAQLGRQGWRAEDIDFSLLQPELARHDRQLFYMVASASFVEITSDLYAANLVNHYRDDPEAVAWLSDHWQHEEVKHGRLLRSYVNAVWPEFDWDTAFADFYREYSSTCTLDALEPGKALEMAARCVVETGTSTLYATLHDYTSEPLLRQITASIRNDEVRHYRQFFRFFQFYNQRERHGSLAILRTLMHRFAEIEEEDGYYAFKHVYRHSGEAEPFDNGRYQVFVSRINGVAREHYPYRTAVKMLLHLLPMTSVPRRLLTPLLVFAARRYMFRPI